MKFIRRWGLIDSTYPENVQEHNLRVAMVAHALAVIRSRLFAGVWEERRKPEHPTNRCSTPPGKSWSGGFSSGG